jgi:hypothetical protein
MPKRRPSPAERRAFARYLRLVAGAMGLCVTSVSLSGMQLSDYIARLTVSTHKALRQGG